ncbi:hypothetical protein BHE74_00045576 [Ensete ventricosum]|nr:hypothetical protein BHE74_00045576 [Ensete ventricosum]
MGRGSSCGPLVGAFGGFDLLKGDLEPLVKVPCSLESSREEAGLCLAPLQVASGSSLRTSAHWGVTTRGFSTGSSPALNSLVVVEGSSSISPIWSMVGGPSLAIVASRRPLPCPSLRPSEEAASGQPVLVPFHFQYVGNHYPWTPNSILKCSSEAPLRRANRDPAVEVATTYCRRSLSPTLAEMIYCCPSEVLADLYSRYEVLVRLLKMFSTVLIWALIDQLSRVNTALRTQVGRPEEEKKVTEAWAIENRKLKEQLSVSYDRLVATQLIVEAAKKAWEEERSYIAKQDRRVVASYKESEGFYSGLEHANRVVYEFRYQISLKCFKMRYPKLKIDEDPFAELTSDAKVLAPTKVPFDNRPTTPLALPPPF